MNLWQRSDHRGRSEIGMLPGQQWTLIDMTVEMKNPFRTEIVMDKDGNSMMECDGTQCGAELVRL